MIGPFGPPATAMAPHARLLYSDSLSPQESWEKWPESLQVIDRFIESQPRLSLANSGLYLYFFGEESKACWVGREIIGHVARAEMGLNTFDSFKSEVFTWSLPNDQFEKLNSSALVASARQLRSLAGEALAETWRVMIDPMEPWTVDGRVHKDLPQVTFQFYKKD